MKLRKDKQPKEADTTELLGANIALGESRTPPSEDFLNSLGRSVYMVLDPEVTAILKSKPYLRTLLPAFSHLMRITKIGPKSARMLELDYEALLLVHEMDMKEDSYESKGMATLLSLGIFSQGIINDSFNGFKATIITEQLKKIVTEIERKDQKRRWPF